jgi:hypothetical protein
MDHFREWSLDLTRRVCAAAKAWYMAVLALSAPSPDWDVFSTLNGNQGSWTGTDDHHPINLPRRNDSTGPSFVERVRASPPTLVDLREIVAPPQLTRQIGGQLNHPRRGWSRMLLISACWVVVLCLVVDTVVIVLRHIDTTPCIVSSPILRRGLYAESDIHLLTALNGTHGSWTGMDDVPYSTLLYLTINPET